MAEPPIDRRKKKEGANRRRRYNVAVEGFSDFERSTLSSFFRLAARRSPSYVEVAQAAQSDFVIADADHPPARGGALSAGRAHVTVFIGKQSPPGAMAWLPRPIHPMHIMRELDSLVEQGQTVPGLLDEAEAVPGMDLVLDDMTFDAQDSPDLLLSDIAGAGPDVLVVEDSPIARRFLQVRLQRMGYAVTTATNAEEALVWMQGQAFALVFLDVVLGVAGGLDGLNLCQMLKQDPAFALTRSAKVVIVSGLSGAMDRVRGSLAGCDAYLTKPVNEAEFERTLLTLDPTLAARLKSRA